MNETVPQACDNGRDQGDRPYTAEELAKLEAFATESADASIARDGLAPGVLRHEVIQHNLMLLIGGDRKADAYHRLVWRRAQRRLRSPRRQARQPQILRIWSHHPSRRTTRSRRSPTTGGRPTGDPGDGEPPEAPGNRRCLPAEVAP